MFVDARKHAPHGDGANDDALASLVCAPNHWWPLRCDEHSWTLHNLEFLPTHCLTRKVPTWSL